MGVIKRQGIKNTIITYLGIIIGFVSLIIIQPQLLSPSELGLIRIIISFSGFLLNIFHLGVTNINIRYFPYFNNYEKKHHGYFGLMLLFPLSGCLIGGIIFYQLKDSIIEQYIQQSKLFTEYFNFIFPMAVLMTLIAAASSYSSALLKTTIPSFLNDILNKSLFIIVIVLYFLGIIDLNQFVFLTVVIYGIQLLLLIIYIYLYDNPGLLIDWQFLKKNINIKSMVQYGLLLMLTSMSSVSLKYLDSIMIAKYLPLAFVGVYSISAFISTVIETPLFSLERIATAKIAQAWALNNIEEIKKIYYSSSKYMSLTGGILLIGILVNINDMLNLLPEAYHQGIYVAIIMSISAFINMITGVNSSILSNSPKYLYGFLFMVVLLICAIAGNIIFIPKYGIEGAAFATAFASIVYNILKYFYIWRVFKMQPFDISMMKILGVMALCFVINFLIPQIENHIVAIIVRSSVITIVYASATYLLNIVPEFHRYIPFIGKKK